LTNALFGVVILRLLNDFRNADRTRWQAGGMMDAPASNPLTEHGVAEMGSPADSPPTDNSRRNGYHAAEVILPPQKPRTSRWGWFSGLLAHLETGLVVALPVAPVIATFLTVVLYIDPLQPAVWRQITASVPMVLMVPGNIVLVWLSLGLGLALLRLGTAARANPGSYAQLNTRLLGFEMYRSTKAPRQDGVLIEHSLDLQLDFVWRALEVSGPKWMLGDGFISLWRQVDQMDSLLNYLLPTYRVWARAQGLLLRLPGSTASAPSSTDVRGQLTAAIALLNGKPVANKVEAAGATTTRSGEGLPAESRARGGVAQIQMLIDSGRTDRYSGLLRARNIMLAACTMTSIAVYALFWLGIVALPATPTSQGILGASLFFTTVGALVGLFQVLYAEAQADTGVDDYGLSIARIVVAPQLAGLAALLGVVLTSLATSTLSGSPATAPVTNTIPAALDQIRNPANVLVAVAFALSPGLVFSRFRENVEQTKRELIRTGGASSVQSKTDR
jgi:hypothetical protein